MLLYGWELFIVSTTFPGWWLLVVAISGDIKYLICHVTSPNHMLEGSCNFMCENFSLYGTTLVVKFGGHRYGDSRDVFSLSCDLTTQRD